MLGWHCLFLSFAWWVLHWLFSKTIIHIGQDKLSFPHQHRELMRLFSPRLSFLVSILFSIGIGRERGANRASFNCRIVWATCVCHRCLLIHRIKGSFTRLAENCEVLRTAGHRHPKCPCVLQKRLGSEKGYPSVYRQGLHLLDGHQWGSTSAQYPQRQRCCPCLQFG